MFSTPKPFTAVTVQIEGLTSEGFEENDLSGLVELIEVIRLQSTGPTEAARALRKKLKYGNVHRQLRALTLLDGLVQNAGPRFQRAFCDEPLLERLRIAGTDAISDPAVRAKCKELFGQWAVSFKDTPGMAGIASLYRQLPRKRPVQAQSKVLKDTEEEARHDVASLSDEALPSSPKTPKSNSRRFSMSSGGSSSLWSPLHQSNKTKKDKHKNKSFNLEKEKPALQSALGSASVASTNLKNALKLTNRESLRVSEDPEVIRRFEECKQLRRQILRYIQLVESEQWLGSLIHANDELVSALTAFEILDKSIDDDSDSATEWDLPKPTDGDERPQEDVVAQAKALEKLKIGETVPTLPLKPPRPPKSKPILMPGNGKGRQEDIESVGSEEEDENDPFADRNEVFGTTPETREGQIWKDV